MACRYIDACNRFSRAGNLRRCGNRRCGQLFRMCCFCGEGVGARLDDTGRLLMKFGRVEANHARERLAVGEAAVGSHQPVGMPRRDFDMIAENRIVPDFE